MPLAIPLGPLISHLEAPHGGGGAHVLVAFPLPIAAVHVQGVLRLARYIHALLLPLPHFFPIFLLFWGGARVERRSTERAVG